MLSFYSLKSGVNAGTVSDSIKPVKEVRLLVVIINHGHNQKALDLKASFGRLAPTIAIDSGSVLTPDQRAGFDWCLPNVYYTGCLFAAAAAAKAGGYTHLWVWASDVHCDAPDLALLCCHAVFRNTDAAVYAPSAYSSFHRQMAPRPELGLQRVTYVDGFCFATRTDLLTQACSDFTGFRYGFGVDLHLGLLARKLRQSVYVDHRYHVLHPPGAGYSVRKATAEWRSWQRRQPVGTLLFHRLAKKRISKTSFGMKLLLALPW